MIVIDEFPYLIETDSSLPSIIQRLWDLEVDESRATLVLTGSAIGMIHEQVLDGGASLYGRVSQSPNGRIELRQLPFHSLTEFVPDYDREELVFVYGIFGGTPRYLDPLDSTLGLGENITRFLLDSDGTLHDEPETVLQMELTEVTRFFSLLESMASGNRERHEIAQGAGIDNRDASYYFSRLELLDIIEQHHPVTADPTRTKKTRYRICDPLFRFYFKYLHGRAGLYELYGDDAYTDLIEPELSNFVSDTFEVLCHQSISELYPNLRLMSVPGQWWYNDREIDIVAPTDEETLIVGEVKSTNGPLGYDVLSRLEDDVPYIDWTPTGGGDPEYEYALFSRSGFKRSVREAAEDRDDLRLFDLDSVVDAITPSQGLVLSLTFLVSSELSPDAGDVSRVVEHSVADGDVRDRFYEQQSEIESREFPESESGGHRSPEEISTERERQEFQQEGVFDRSDDEHDERELNDLKDVLDALEHKRQPTHHKPDADGRTKRQQPDRNDRYGIDHERIPHHNGQQREQTDPVQNTHDHVHAHCKEHDPDKSEW